MTRGAEEGAEVRLKSKYAEKEEARSLEKQKFLFRDR